MREANNVRDEHGHMTRDEWQQILIRRRDELARCKAMVDGATILDQVLCELEGVTTSEGDSVLTLGVAAARSGYSVEHLARLVRDGTIQNVGRKYAPRIRLRDLPKKPLATVAPRRPQRYDPTTDARRLRDRRLHGDSYGDTEPAH
jgi:hypothetical protein